MVGGFSTRQQGEDWFEGKYTTQKQDASQLSMDVSGIISPSLTGTIWVNVTALENPDETNLFLHTVIVRKTYGPYNGGNGVTTHHWVVRKMLPTYSGDAFIISSGQTVSKEYQFDLSQDRAGSDYFSKKDDMAVVAFVQSHTTTKVTSEGAPRDRNIAPILQATYGDFEIIPNKAPLLSKGRIDAPVDADQDDDVTFKAFYQDVDDMADFGPTEAKVYFKNETSSVMEHGLAEIPSGDPWTVGKWVGWTTKLAPGTYTYRFSASDGEADAIGDVEWNATEVRIRSRNKIPELMSSSFMPLHGDTTTKFRFNVMYRDFENEEPTSAKIYLNGMGYDMITDSTGPFNDWVMYYRDTTLPVGTNHKFYFVFSDGLDERRYPPAIDSPNWIQGPEVVPPNNEPTLTTALFSPNEGTRTDEFTFSIIYTDGEGDRPALSYIYIDDVPSIMEADGEDFIRGQVYRYTTTLDLGEHWIRYQFTDGKHEARHPVSGSIEGPLVTNMAPMAVIDRPNNDQRFTPDDYVPFSAVGSEDPENDELTYLWESDIDGQLSSAKAFDKPLSEGFHVITLTVTDEHDAEHMTSIGVIIKPYLAAPFFEGYVSNNERPVEKDPVRYTVTLNNNGEANALGVEVRFMVDDVTQTTETITINMEVQKAVIFNWEALPGEHEIVFEIVGDSISFLEYVDANLLPAIAPAERPKAGGSNYKVGDQIYFDPHATDGNDDDLTYHWDFGDFTTSDTKIGDHIYLKAGTYPVTLTVTDSRGGQTEESFDMVIAKESSGSSSNGSGLYVLVGIIVIVLVIVIVVAVMLLRGKPGTPAADESATPYGDQPAAPATPGALPEPPVEETPEVPQNGFPEYSDELKY